MKKPTTFGHRNMCDHTPAQTHRHCSMHGYALEVCRTVIPSDTIYVVNFHIYTINRVKESFLNQDGCTRQFYPREFE